MLTALVEFGPRRVVAGFVEDNEPQIKLEYDPPLWQGNIGVLSASEKAQLQTKLHLMFEGIFDTLLVTASRTHVVLVEPILCPLLLKHLLADVLFTEFRAASLAFLPFSVCLVVGAGTTNGLAVACLLGEVFVVPVYDCKEMTTLIQSSRYPVDSDEGDDEGNTTTRALIGTLQTLNPDARSKIQNNIVFEDPIIAAEIVSRPSLGAWVGGSVLASQTTVKHVITRARFLNHEDRVFDSLFDIW